jgi:ABC-type ATPase involved in cell division
VLIATHDMALVRRAKSDVLRLADGMVVRVPPQLRDGQTRDDQE